MAQRCRNFRRDSRAPLHPHIAAHDADPPSHVLHLTFSHLHVVTRAALFSRFAVRALLRKVTMTENSRCTDAASSPTSISRARVSARSRQPISGLSSPSLRYATIRVSEYLKHRSAINIVSDKTRPGNRVGSTARNLQQQEGSRKH